MITAHRICLKPNVNQARYFARAAGTRRFAYNWALAEWTRQYELHKADPENPNYPKPNEGALRKQFNQFKKTEGCEWIMEVTKCAPQMGIKDLGKAFLKFMRGKSKYPTFKKKGVARDSFTISNDQFKVDGRKLRIPNLGWVRMREELRFQGKLLWATVSRTADRWYVSFTVETTDDSHLHAREGAETQGEQTRCVGVDLGINRLATLSDGTEMAGPKPHTQLLRRLKRLSRQLSRKKKGSRNRKKAKMALARLHAKIARIRVDALHKLTTALVLKYDWIAVEDLGVSGMLKNHCLARAIADMGWGEFRRQLEYKAAWYRCHVSVVDRFYPSSKTCSVRGCGHVMQALPLGVRSWACPACGTQHDRDVNAARNILTESFKADSYAVSACGG